MAKTSVAEHRCSRCSAGLRPGAPWCTQCYAPTAPLAAAPSVVTVVERPARGGTWPCSACGTANDLALPTCEGCGTPFLADERGAVPTVVLPVVGDLLALSPVRRVGVAVGVVVAFVVAAAVLGLLLS